MLRYPIVLTPDDNDTLLVTSPDFPELKTFGDDQTDACLHAADALASVIAARIDNLRPVPLPSPISNTAAVLSARDALKIALYQAMTADQVRRPDLARRLATSPTEVDRLLDLMHPSSLDDLETALRALGRDVTVLVDHAVAG